MPDACGDCLRQLVCEVTGASCPKLAALIQKLDHDSSNQEGDTTMTNTAKNSGTPKTVAEAVAAAKKNNDDATVPAQATSTEPKDGAKTETTTDGQTEKTSVVQKLKARVERLKSNKSVVLIVAAGVVGAIVGSELTKRRSASAVTTDDVVADTEIHTVGEDDTTDES
jgi:cobalamin biosynthesis Mg chelatase CobN